MVKKLTRKALGLLVFAAVLLMPFAVTAAIPAKPALNGNLIAGDPVIPATAIFGDAPIYSYDEGTDSLSSVKQPPTRYYVDYPLASSLTADSNYVISVDYSIPADGRYDGSAGYSLCIIFRKTADGKYLGLEMFGNETHLRTYTKAADGSLSPAFVGSIDGCLPDGSSGTIKIYSTPNSVRFSVYDANGNPVNLTWGGGNPIGSEHGWGANEIKGGEPAFGVANCGMKFTFSDALVYNPTFSVEGNLVTGAPSIPDGPSAYYSYDSASGILSVGSNYPGNQNMIEYPLSADLKAKDTYTVAFDYSVLQRWGDSGCGPVVFYRKTTDGRYLGLYFAEEDNLNSTLQHGYFTVDPETKAFSLETSFDRAGGIIDPLVDGKGGSIVIESTPTSTILSVYDDQGNPVTLQYRYNGDHDIGVKQTFTYDNIGDPALGVTLYGSNTTISNVVVLSDTVDDNTVEVGTLNNGAVAINGDVDVNDMEAGSTVTLTVTPAQGYQIKAGSLAYVVDGKTYPITTRVGEVDGAGNTFAFAMPEGNVSITAEFIDAGADNMATLGASYKDNDLRFVNRVYRTNARGELKNCGNYLLRADSALGAAFADGAALTEQQKADLLAAVAAGTAFKVPTTVLNDRCEDYIDFAVRINGAGQDGYSDKAYVCVSYATFDNGDTIYGNACVRSFDGVKNAVSGQ